MWRQDHPDADLQDVPGDLVTTSASGLDPHITLQNAEISARRVASKWAANLKRDPAAVRKEIEQILQENASAPGEGSPVRSSSTCLKSISSFASGTERHSVTAVMAGKRRLSTQERKIARRDSVSAVGRNASYVPSNSETQVLTNRKSSRFPIPLGWKRGIPVERKSGPPEVILRPRCQEQVVRCLAGKRNSRTAEDSENRISCILQGNRRLWSASGTYNLNKVRCAALGPDLPPIR